MDAGDRMDKIKIGKIANTVTSIIFVLWIIVTFVMLTVDVKTYLMLCGVLMAVFAASVIVGHICLKDYKEEKEPEDKEE